MNFLQIKGPETYENLSTEEHRLNLSNSIQISPKLHKNRIKSNSTHSSPKQRTSPSPLKRVNPIIQISDYEIKNTCSTERESKRLLNPLIKTMIEISSSQNESVKINKMKNKEFLQMLDEKTLEISKLIHAKIHSFQYNTLKFTLMILIRSLDRLTTYANLDIIKLDKIRMKFAEFQGILIKNLPKNTQSKNLKKDVKKIMMSLNEYTSQHLNNDIILRVGSLEDMKKLEEEFEMKKNTFSIQIIKDPSEYDLRTRIMRSSKFAGLKVDTSNISAFRYLGKKPVQNEVVIVEKKDTITDILEKNIVVIVFLIGSIVLIIILLMIL